MACFIKSLYILCKRAALAGIFMALAVGETSADAKFDKYLEQAKIGDLRSQIIVGLSYEEGEGVEKDVEEALIWFHKVAEKESEFAKYAQSRIGFSYIREIGEVESNKKAIMWLRKAADQGYVQAQYWLGYMHESGRGTIQNHRRAATWYLKAAEQGDTSAQVKVGDFYSVGKGVEPDYKKSEFWFRQAVKKQNSGALYGLYNGYIPLFGTTAYPDDIVRKHMWANIALSLGGGQPSLLSPELLRKQLKLVENKMSNDEITEAQNLAGKCIESNYDDC